MSGGGSPVVLTSYQPFPKLDAPIVPDPQSGLCGPVWERFFMRLWILAGGQVTAQANGAVINQTPSGSGAPLQVVNVNNGKVLGTLNLANQPGETPVPQTLGSSPFTATASGDGFWIASSGKVSITRDAATQVVGLTGACVPLAKGDQLKVEWTVSVPTVVYYPSGAAG